MKKTIFIILLMLCVGITLAQSPDSLRAVKVLGRAQQTKILIRWAPTDPITWEYANKYGYMVERYTIVRDGEIIKPEKKLITLQPLKPAPSENWENIIDNDDYAAIAAQAIFGETFEISAGKNSSLIDIVNKSTENEQRFSFALFSADHSFVTAKLSGLALADSLVKKGEKYFYKVYTATPPKILAVDTGYVYIGLADYADLPTPRDLTAYFADNKVTLKWPVKFLLQTYVSYIVERSDDGGKSFVQIKNKPFINPEKADEKLTHYTMVDSLPSINKEFQYRVRGVTPFAEVGPPSESVSGKGIEKMVCQPAITSNTVTDEQQVHLIWKNECDDLALLNGFEVRRSVKVDGDYKKVSDLLPATTHEFVDQSPLPTSYYIITALGKNSEQINSFPVLVQLEDSIPPASPKDVTITIDTAGIVKLSWKANGENDLLGYRVFRSNFKNSEFGQITVSPISDNAFTDTVNIQTLTKKVYYKISAVDKRFNPSEYSDVVFISKPDNIPPVPPVINTVRSSFGGVELKWSASSSNDVDHYILWRKHPNTKTWRNIMKLDNQSISYTDLPNDSENVYQYTLTAVDSAGNSSQPSKAVSAKKLFELPKTTPKITYVVDRENKLIRLKWQYDQENIISYVIYRGLNNEPLNLFRTVPVTQKNIEDSSLTVNSTYKYRIKAVFRNGFESAFSDEIEVKY